MCFSASASFGAGAVLCIAGLITLKKVQSPSQLLFASIPLLFSVQQFTEGFVWLSLTYKEYEIWKFPSTYLFLFFAQVVWPVFVPLAIFQLEKDAKRKKILKILIMMGVAVALYLAFCLFKYPVNAVIESLHISYSLSFPLFFSTLSGIFYFVPTVFPSLISSNKKAPLLGITITASYLYTKIFYQGFLISVWCFFAAVISIIILYILTNMNKVTDAGNKHQPIVMQP